MRVDFEKLWDVHNKWSLGLFIKSIRDTPTFRVFFGNTSDQWFNFALPKVSNPLDLDIRQVSEALKENNPKASVYLFEQHIKSGFPEFLVRNNYYLLTQDTWVVLDRLRARTQRRDRVVEEVGLENFGVYEEIAEEGFSDFVGYDLKGEREYLKICFEHLSGKRKGGLNDLEAKYFIAKENSEPVAAFGLFLSKSLNFGYLHNGATRKAYRRRGYQRLLIDRICSYCTKRRLSLVYALVEYGSVSWRNFVRAGFYQVQIANIFSLK